MSPLRKPNFTLLVMQTKLIQVPNTFTYKIRLLDHATLKLNSSSIMDCSALLNLHYHFFSLEDKKIKRIKINLKIPVEI